jgi:hypothetical protein
LHPNRHRAGPFVFETTPVRLSGSLSKVAEDGDHASQPVIHRPSTFPACAGPRPVHPPKWRWVEVLTPNGTKPVRLFSGQRQRACLLNPPKGAPMVGVAPTLIRVRSAADYLLPTWARNGRATPELHRDCSALGLRRTFCCRVAQMTPRRELHSHSAA